MVKRGNLLHAAYWMMSIDGEITSPEVQRLIASDYWNKFAYPGAGKDNIKLAKDDLLLAYCKDAISSELIFERDRKEFVLELYELMTADGVATKDEIQLFRTLASFAQYSADDVDAMIMNRMSERSSVVGNKLILSALTMISSDGDVHPKEMRRLREDPYWANIFYEGCLEEYGSQSTEETFELIKKEAAKHLTTEAAKNSFMVAILRLVVADGEIDDQELVFFRRLAEMLDISDAKLKELVQRFQQRQSGTRQPEKNDDSKVVAIVIAVIVLSLAAVAYFSEEFQ